MLKNNNQEINYRNPEFYMAQYRQRFEIIDKVKANTLPTLHNLKDYYEIHMFCDGYIAVFNTERKRYLKPYLGVKRRYYFYYSLYTKDGKQKNRYMHRLVGLWKVDGWQEGLVTDHIDCDSLNCLSNNLEWVTIKENTQRAVANGLGVGRPRVVKAPKPLKTALQRSQGNSKLSFDDISLIFHMAKEGKYETLIAKEFGVSQPSINMILTGKRWASHPASIKYRQRITQMEFMTKMSVTMVHQRGG